jgi:hypothetical protein
MRTRLALAAFLTRKTHGSTAVSGSDLSRGVAGMEPWAANVRRPAFTRRLMCYDSRPPLDEPQAQDSHHGAPPLSANSFAALRGSLGELPPGEAATNAPGPGRDSDRHRQLTDSAAAYLRGEVELDEFGGHLGVKVRNVAKLLSAPRSATPRNRADAPPT